MKTFKLKPKTENTELETKHIKFKIKLENDEFILI